MLQIQAVELLNHRDIIVYKENVTAVAIRPLQLCRETNAFNMKTFHSFLVDHDARHI